MRAATYVGLTMLLAGASAHASDACRFADRSQRLAEVTWTPPGVPVAGLVVTVHYPKDKVALPGDGGDDVVKRHVLDAASDALVSPNDRGDSVKIALLKTDGLSTGHLVTLDFRDCDGAAAPVADDFRCEVADASDPQGNEVPGVVCRVALP